MMIKILGEFCIARPSPKKLGGTCPLPLSPPPMISLLLKLQGLIFHAGGWSRIICTVEINFVLGTMVKISDFCFRFRIWCFGSQISAKCLLRYWDNAGQQFNEQAIGRIR